MEPIVFTERAVQMYLMGHTIVVCPFYWLFGRKWSSYPIAAVSSSIVSLSIPPAASVLILLFVIGNLRVQWTATGSGPLRYDDTANWKGWLINAKTHDVLSMIRSKRARMRRAGPLSIGLLDGCERWCQTGNYPWNRPSDRGGL